MPLDSNAPQGAPSLHPAPHKAPTGGTSRTVSVAKAPRQKPDRGATSTASSTAIKTATTLRTLLMLDRFRVCRTIDVSLFFPERPYKAALVAAQRSMRANFKAGFVKRYKTSRFMTIYGLTKAGVDWLDEQGFTASSSVRRVSEMTNVEHRLWGHFLVLSALARGLGGMTESELLLELSRQKGSPQGLLTVNIPKGQSSVAKLLRPDAVIDDASGQGSVWFEVQLSKMGSDKEVSFSALSKAVGATLKNGKTLKKVVLFAKTPRIEKRAIDLVDNLASGTRGMVLIGNRKHFKKTADKGVYEVWGAVSLKDADGRSSLVDRLQGHICVQLLPVWLPKLRLGNNNCVSGWFGDNYLPYKRPASEGHWAKAEPLPPVAPPEHVD